MGGDEAKNFPKFQILLDKIINWGNSKKIEIIAWDDILSSIEKLPANLII